jgi:hypothetical protein
MSLVVSVGIAVFGLTLFLDVLEMSFGRILWFIKTLRFWLYFTLHFLMSCLAAYLIHSKIPDWFLLAPAATFLGVAIISNTNIKLAGFSLVPVADMFVSIKTKMIDQAGQDKATEIRKAQLIQRLRKLNVKKLEDACSAALIAAKQPPDRIQGKVDKARDAAKSNQDYLKNILIDTLLKANLPFVEANIELWEKES